MSILEWISARSIAIQPAYLERATFWCAFKGMIRSFFFKNAANLNKVNNERCCEMTSVFCQKFQSLICLHGVTWNIARVFRGKFGKIFMSNIRSCPHRRAIFNWLIERQHWNIYPGDTVQNVGKSIPKLEYADGTIDYMGRTIRISCIFDKLSISSL